MFFVQPHGEDSRHRAALPKASCSRKLPAFAPISTVLMTNHSVLQPHRAGWRHDICAAGNLERAP